MNNQPNVKYEYQVGGSLPVDAPTYVKRKADQDFYEGLKAGEFCYVLNSRQMGKSSLRVQTMARFQQEGFACAAVDITAIGTSEITPEEWYFGIIDSLVNSFELYNHFDSYEWWTTHELLSPMQRFSKFLSEVLLKFIDQSIVIFIDEIDSVLALPFNIDDFFAVIRDCFNQRADKPDYNRLTFALIGVATPSDLISDRRRTPFNIGRAIELIGFQLTEAKPLAVGLETQAKNSQALLEAVLYWTGGQPFLTQKVCKLVLNCADSEFIQNPAEWVEKLVKEKVIENWEGQDEPEHLKTIRDRILRSEQRAGRLLGLYQQILQHNEIVADDTAEQMELRLTGLVVKKSGKLKVYNPIYQAVFNREWVEKQLANLRPYSENLKFWIESECQDESRLLRGQALQEAQTWAADKSLSDLDYQFLNASRELKKREEERRLRLTILGLGGFSAAAVSLAGVTGFGWWSTAINQIYSFTQNSDAFYKNDRSQPLKASLKAVMQMQQTPWVNANTRTPVELTLLNAVSNVAAPNALGGHARFVNAISFSPDGKLLITGSYDNTIKKWDSTTGEEIQTLTGHTNLINAVSFSPDGKLLASASGDKTLKLWDITSGKEIKTIIGHTSGVSDVSFSPDGKLLASASSDKTVKLWDITSGKEIKTIIGHTSGVSDVSFSPDGKLLASASSDKTVKLWDITTGKLIQTFAGHEDMVNSISFSPDGKLLASASSDKTLKLWDTSTGKLIKTFAEHTSGVYDISFSPDGKLLASASSDKTVKLWDITTGKLIKTFAEHTEWVNSVSFSPDGKLLATGSDDNTAKLWDIATGKQIKTFAGHEDMVNSVSFSPDDKLLATGSSDNTVKLWDISTKKLNKILIGHTKEVWSTSFSPDGKLLASASGDNTVKLWDTNTGKEIKTLSGHKNWVNSVSFSPDGKLLASASGDNTVKLWDTNTGKEIKTLTGHPNAVNAVSFSPDGKRLATGSSDNTVKLWDTNTRKEIQTLIGHTDLVNSVSFSPDGKLLVSATNDRTVKLWDITTGKEIKTLTGHTDIVNSVKFSSDGKLIASVSKDNTVKLWKWDYNYLIDEGCRFIGEYLKPNPDDEEALNIQKNLCESQVNK